MKGLQSTVERDKQDNLMKSKKKQYADQMKKICEISTDNTLYNDINYTDLQ